MVSLRANHVQDVAQMEIALVSSTIRVLYVYEEFTACQANIYFPTGLITFEPNISLVPCSLQQNSSELLIKSKDNKGRTA